MEKKKLTDEELELLQALHNVIGIEPLLLNNIAYNRYNELADRADEENLVW